MSKSSSDRDRQQRLQRLPSVLRELYASERGQARVISNSFRRAQGEDDHACFTYGEVEVAAFLQILALVKADDGRKDRKFVDLGCGAGLPCMCAALSGCGFSSVLGIEIVDGLVSLAQSLHAKFVRSLEGNAASSGGEKAVRGKRPPVAAEEADLWPVALQCIRAHCKDDNDTMKVDLLANEVCKRIGHKRYKASVKKHKSFLAFLEAHADSLRLSEDGKELSLCSSPAPAKLPFEEPVSPIADASINIAEEEEKEDVSEIRDFALTADRALFRDIPPVQYVHASFFEVDWWSDSDVAFTCSVLFSDEMMLSLRDLVLRMKAGSFFVTLKPLPLRDSDKDRIKLVSDSFFKMSWQMARVLVYRIT